MKVLVLGASGSVGSRLVGRARERGHEVTAFVRDPAKLAVDGVRVVTGDVMEPGTLEPAVQGQDAVLSALGAPKPEEQLRVEVQGMRNLVSAMSGAGVRRLIAVSAYGAGESSGELGWFLTNVIARLTPLGASLRAKEQMEAEIRASDLDWTIVQPARLTNGERTDKAKVIFEGGGLSAKVSRADVAEFILDELESGQYVRRAPGLTY